MTVVQKFYWIWPDNAKKIEFDDWVNTLPEPDKSECIAGINRQHKMRQQAIDREDMTITKEGYAWKDSETAKRGKGVDEVWEKYWLRWQIETGVKFSSIFKEE